jgi:hypothetical protein
MIRTILGLVSGDFSWLQEIRAIWHTKVKNEKKIFIKAKV